MELALQKLNPNFVLPHVQFLTSPVIQSHSQSLTVRRIFTTEVNYKMCVYPFPSFVSQFKHLITEC